MTHLALSPAVLRPLSLVLLHFLWQGLALAAVFYALLSICCRPTTRYALGVATLVLMMSAPAATFLLLTPSSGAVRSSLRPLVKVEMREAATPMAAPGAPLPAPEPIAPDGYLWLAEAWFAGVVFFSLRAAGGLLWLQRLRKKSAQPVGKALAETFLALQRKLGLDRVVRYCESDCLEAPAVVGWFRPMVLLPVTTLTGLDAQQLEAVIAHELAHIRRLDGFVNLFQVAAEALLFYHPAVWWVNRQIRVERENCCDDIAVTVSGATDYARALMTLEERRGSMSLALAANGSPLARRIARLLGLPRPGGELQGITTAVGVLALAGALLAATALLGVTHSPQPTNIHSLATASTPPAVEPETTRTEPMESSDPVDSAQPASRPVAENPEPPASSRTEEHGGTSTTVQKEVRVLTAQRWNWKPILTLAYAQQSSGAEGGKDSYTAGMQAEGFKNLSADQLIALKVQGVTPAYIHEMREAGFKPDLDELIGLKVQGVTAAYVREIQSAGFTPNLNQIVALKVQGVTGAYIRDMHAAGVNLASLDRVIGMKVQGVTPEYIRGLNAEGLHPNEDQIIGMKVQGVTPEYVRDMKAAGIAGSVDQLIGLKVQGVTPEYVRELKALGLGGNADALIGMKVQGVTPGYVRDIRGTGLNPSADQLLGMKVQGVTADYIHSLQSAGLKNLTVNDYVSAKVMGVTPDFVEKARSHGFKDLSLDKLIALKQADAF